MTQPQLTATLQRTYDAIHAFEQRCGHGPTARELARTLDIGPTTAAWHIRQLRDLGRVSWDARPGGREPGRARVMQHNI